MTKKRCIPCGGSGRVMGGGMMMTDCEYCNGAGKVELIDDETEYLLAKQTKHFKSAIKRIKAIDKSITDDEAEKIFSEEYNKSSTVRASVEIE
jgi:hypothetical protein